MFNFQRFNRMMGLGVFLLSFLAYLTTVSPTVSYWDCGEFAACAYSLGVPHPPGSPLFLIVGRLFTMLPLSEAGHALGLAMSSYDVAFRVNLISVLASAFAVLFLYLIILRLVLQWKGRPDNVQAAVKLAVASAIGALTFAFTYSHWFNAVEAEVYASSTFFTAIVVWLIMVWVERPDDIHGDAYLLLIAYMIGLAIGVHLLNILALPFIFFIIYAKKFEITMGSLLKFAVVGIVAVAVIYKVFIFWSLKIPLVMDRYGLAGISIALLFGLLIYLSYYFIRRNSHTAALVTISSLLIFIGYSTYAVILIRSGMNPNIDQNDPATWTAFVRYLNREQYGDFSTFPRVAPFWDYQFNKMFVRYFNWQFVGRPDDTALSLMDQLRNAIGWTVDRFQDTQEDRFGYMFTVFSIRGLYGLPFLVGLFGMVHHFSKDWKRALAVLGLFIMTGVAIIVYLNQPDPQPRERDYSYVGAFFSFSIWIGIGAYAILEAIEERIADVQKRRLAMYGAMTLLLLLLPVNMYAYNATTSSRQGNYVAWDYSYNLLQSCEPNAILFTNGDNDTFPLWYLQEVEKVRPDIRIANLSLLNTDWYIYQLKNQETEYHLADGSVVKAEKVPISYNDREILGDPNIPNSAIQPTRWRTRTFNLEVPRDVYWRDWLDSDNPLPHGHDTASIPRFTFEVKPTISGQGLRVQDMLILDMLIAGKWKRPIYFALTVSDDNKVGLDRYLRMDGLAFKLVTVADQDMSATRLYENVYKKFLFRGMDDLGVCYDDNVRRLTQNYRTLYLRLAEYFRQKKSGSNPRLSGRVETVLPEIPDVNHKIIAILDDMERTMPDSVIPVRDYRIKVTIGQFYADAGKPEKLRRYLEEVLANEKLYRLDNNARVRIAAVFQYSLKDYDASIALLKPAVETDPNNGEALGWYIQALDETRNYEEAARVLDNWIARHPQDGSAAAKLAEVRRKMTPQPADTLHP
jgi:tetratricopeptide (TPR) repeat protein